MRGVNAALMLILIQYTHVNYDALAAYAHKLSVVQVVIYMALAFYLTWVVFREITK